VAREFNRRLKNRFDQLGIELPSQERTLYFGTDKEGHAPPARVEVRFAEHARAEPATGSESAEAKPDRLRSSGD
jgi:small conductance mechanosensitive channel